MEIKIDRDVILKCLNHIQGVVEKKNTLPILANVLIEAFDSKIQISATDLDIIITEKIDAEVARNIARDEVFELNKQNTDLILEANR